MLVAGHSTMPLTVVAEATLRPLHREVEEAGRDRSRRSSRPSPSGAIRSSADVAAPATSNQPRSPISITGDRGSPTSSVARVSTDAAIEAGVVGHERAMSRWWSTSQSREAVSASTSDVLDRREHADAQLVATELAVAVGVEHPVGPQRGVDLDGIDRVVEVDRADHRAALAGIGRRTASSSRSSPPRRRGGSTRRCERSAIARQARRSSSIHCDLIGEHDQRGHRRRVVGLVLPAVGEGDTEVERCRSPSVRCRRCVRCARRRPVSTPPATARRRRRSTSGERSSRRRRAPGPRPSRRRRWWRRRRRGHRRCRAVGAAASRRRSRSRCG